MHANFRPTTRTLRRACGVLLAALAACALPLATAHAATVIYVSPAGAGSASGADWADAATLPNALAAAVAGDQLWVQAGTYLPGQARTAAFALKSGVAIYGGFAGDETDLQQRDPASNPTTLSGDIGTPGDAADNSYHVVVGRGVDQAAVLDGFTISGGNANAPADGLGGGILLMQSSATIRNCTVRANRADTGGGIGVSGGGPVLSRLVVEDNQATYGGGISTGSAVLSMIILRGNRAGYGGAIDVESGSPAISEVLLSGNQATIWGGGILAWRSTPTIRQATIAGNSAPNGGAIAVQDTTLLLRNSIVWGNGAQPIGIYSTSSVDSAYSLIQGGYPGVGNRDQDPQFVDAAGADGTPGTGDDDLHLQATSPAIDAGSNADIPSDLADSDQNGNTAEPIASDLDGHARLVGGTVDLGVYEAPAGTTPPARYYIPLLRRP
jgi:predicted outer membrane repeat protein